MDWDSIYRELKALNWIILLVVASASYFLMSPEFTTGVIFGGPPDQVNEGRGGQTAAAQYDLQHASGPLGETLAV